MKHKEIKIRLVTFLSEQEIEKAIKELQAKLCSADKCTQVEIKPI